MPSCCLMNSAPNARRAGFGGAPVVGLNWVAYTAYLVRWHQRGEKNPAVLRVQCAVKRQMKLLDWKPAVMVFSVHLHQSAVGAIMNCSVRGFNASRSLRLVALQWICLSQESRVIPIFANSFLSIIHTDSILVCWTAFAVPFSAPTIEIFFGQAFCWFFSFFREPVLFNIIVLLLRASLYCFWSNSGFNDLVFFGFQTLILAKLFKSID